MATGARGRKGKGGGERGKGERDGGGVNQKKGEAGPATMTSRACDGEEWEGAEERGREVVKVRRAGPTTLVSRAKELYKEDAKDGATGERGAERVRMELDETCHNGKPGRSDGDGG